MPPLAECALQSWAECEPTGMLLPADKLPLLLPAICLRVPGGMDTPEKAQKLNTAFKARGDSGKEPSLFQEWLRVRDGQVHFLYFWRAFVDAAHLAAGADNSDARCMADAIGAELDTLRDSILRHHESPDSTQLIAARVVVDAVNAAAASSSFPLFWSMAVETVNSLTEAAQHFSFDDFAVMILPWIQAASTWEQRCLEQQTNREARLREREEGLMVNVHVYDVSTEEKVQKLNRVLAHQYSPLKLGGVFHAGIEVLGLEWAYGASDDATRPGVSCMKPRSHPMHHYRQSMSLGRTPLSEGEIGEIISSMLEEYPGDDYDLLRRNCCHFADDFARRLKVGGIPGWVCRLASIGAGLETALQKAQGIPALNGMVDKVMGAVLPQAPDSD